MIPTGLVAALATGYVVSPGMRGFVQEAVGVLSTGNLAEIRSWLQGFGPWSAVVIVLILILQPLLVVVPSVLMMVVAVLAYGPLYGGLLAWGGSTLAALVGYALGWSLHPVTVDRLIGEAAERRIERALRRYGFWSVALFRVSPVLSTDAISIVAGLLEMRLRRYLAATAVGFLPLAGTIALLARDVERLESVLVWGSIFSVVALVAYLGVSQWRQRRDTGR